MFGVSQEARERAPSIAPSWTEKQFGEWLVKGISAYHKGEGRQAFAPFGHYIEKEDFLTSDLASLFGYLSPQQQEFFKKGLASVLASVVLTDETKHLHQELIYLDRWLEESCPLTIPSRRAGT